MLDEHNGRSAPIGGTRAAHRDERRNALILAAYQLIAEKGFEHLRTRDVAARAGVNIATLHYYFASKEDLIRGVVEQLLRDFSSVSAPVAERESMTPLEEVRGMLQETYDRFQERPEMFIVLSELTLRSLHDPLIQKVMLRLDEEWQTYIQHLIAYGISQGAFRIDLDPASTAAYLIVLIKGFFFHRITSPASVHIDQLLDEIARLLTH